MDIISILDLNDFINTLWKFTAYIAIFAISLIVLRYTINIKDYIFRKMLHVVAVTSIFPLIFVAEKWTSSLLVDIIFLAVVFIVLKAVENMAFFDGLFVQKKPHEVIKSFVGLFGMFGFFIIVCWGMMGSQSKFLAVTSVMAWGPGDAMAAIIGINFGRNHLSGRFIEGTKSVEGTLAMAFTSFISVLFSMMVLTQFNMLKIVFYSVIISVVSAFTELYTKGGWDTVSVPVAALLVQIILIYI